MSLPDAFTIALTFADDRRVLLVKEDDRFLGTVHERRATKFATRRGAEDMIAAIEKHSDMEPGSVLTLCDQDGWPILDTIEIPILTLDEAAAGIPWEGR